MRVKSDSENKGEKKNWKSLLWVFQFIKPYKWYFISALVILSVGSLLFLVIPDLAGEMVNVATGKDSKYGLDLTQLGIVIFVVLAIRSVISFVIVILFANVSERGMADLRKGLYDKLISQSVGFFESQRIGELSSRITADVEQLQSVFSMTLAEFMRQGTILIVGIGVLAYLMPDLFLIMLLTIPVVVVLAIYFGRYIRRFSKKRQDQLADTNTIVEETFQNFSVVKAFTNELYESLRYQESLKKMVKISLDFAKVRGLFFAFLVFLMFGGILFILWQGAFMVQRGEMDSGNLLSFVIYTVMIGGAIASLGTLYTTIAGAIGATERVKEIMSRGVELDMSVKSDGGNISGDIHFNHVSFSYPSRTEVTVLQDVTFEVKRGEKIALVGQSGSGKSTLVKLLMRFFEPSQGSISINSKSLESYPLGELRSSVGIVPQEVILFGGTIRENILYGNPDATEEEVKAAADKSNCLEFIESFPEGFDTIVGERGIKLSGGQKQRVAIARTILKDPNILILDEATSSLDAESERLVQEALDVLMEGRTSIIIAHRLATIKNVDCIYVLEHGEIKEEGDHESLIEKEGGIYRKLAKLQFDMV
ncbi:MAG: ABC transporter ATP-binding protein [Saprospiraceae bacterium]|nr:ABC transporter ATP-binding protein [Saprospiraceae bacterium]